MIFDTSIKISTNIRFKIIPEVGKVDRSDMRDIVRGKLENGVFEISNIQFSLIFHTINDIIKVVENEL